MGYRAALRAVAGATIAFAVVACGASSPAEGALHSPTTAAPPTQTLALTSAPPIEPASPAPAATDVVVGNLVFSPADLQRDYERFAHRPQLSAADRRSRDRLVAGLRRSLGVAPPAPVEGVLYQDPGVTLEYISGPDDFEAEVRTADFHRAKRAVEAYLAREGLSAAGICGLPLSYYVNFKFGQTLPAGTRFDPNPLACGGG